MTTSFTPFVCQYVDKDKKAQEIFRERVGNGICIGLMVDAEEGPLNIVLWDKVRTPSPSFHKPMSIEWLDLLENVMSDDDDDDDYEDEDDDDYEDEDDDDEEDLIVVDNSVNDKFSLNNTEVADELEPLENETGNTDEEWGNEVVADVEVAPEKTAETPSTN